MIREPVVHALRTSTRDLRISEDSSAAALAVHPVMDRIIRARDCGLRGKLRQHGLGGLSAPSPGPALRTTARRRRIARPGSEELDPPGDGLSRVNPPWMSSGMTFTTRLGSAM